MKKIILFLLISLQLNLKAQDSKQPQMSPLTYQIGKWLASEIKTDKAGNRFQFGYELQWFDQKQSIAKMIITQVYENGNVDLLWEGFKYWDSEESKILYSGFSSLGITAKGHLEIQSENVIKTIYSGIGPNGKRVFIEDVATKLDNNHYTSETHVKMDGDKKWKTLNTDNWVKVGIQSFNDELN